MRLRLPGTCFPHAASIRTALCTRSHSCHSSAFQPCIDCCLALSYPLPCILCRHTVPCPALPPANTLALPPSRLPALSPSRPAAPQQICRFCYHYIREQMSGLCPACRRAYSDEMISFTPLTADQYVHACEQCILGSSAALPLFSLCCSLLLLSVLSRLISGPSCVVNSAYVPVMCAGCGTPLTSLVWITGYTVFPNAAVLRAALCSAVAADARHHRV